MLTLGASAILLTVLMGLIVRSSQIHAAGCYTTTDIPKGTRIVEYTGPRISKQLADEMYEDSPTTYLFGVTDEVVIDGHGMAMFINHCCDPNCETDDYNDGIWIFAIRDIRAGEELTYDYCLYDGDDDDEAPCYCGARTCRGTMYSEDEVKRRAKAARKALAEAQKKRKKSATPPVRHSRNGKRPEPVGV